MKKIVLLVAVVIALMAAGVIHFQKDGDEVNISIDKARLKQVSGKLIKQGKHLIDETRDEFDDKRERTADFGEEIESEFRNQTRRFTPSQSR